MARLAGLLPRGRQRHPSHQLKRAMRTTNALCRAAPENTAQNSRSYLKVARGKLVWVCVLLDIPEHVAYHKGAKVGKCEKIEERW